MKNEININIQLNQKEKLFVMETIAILQEVRTKLRDYKDNGFYPFVDHVELPDELEQLADAVADIGQLML